MRRGDVQFPTRAAVPTQAHLVGLLFCRAPVGLNFSKHEVVGKNVVVSNDNSSLSGSLSTHLHYISVRKLVAEGLSVGIV